LRLLFGFPCHTAGLFSQSFPGYPGVYASGRYLDKLMLAAAWLHRATGMLPVLGTQSLGIWLLGSYTRPCQLGLSVLLTVSRMHAAGNTSYLDAAHRHYQAAGGRWQISPYISFDHMFVPAVAVLLK
jgi:hypothetical protein